MCVNELGLDLLKLVFRNFSSITYWVNAALLKNAIELQRTSGINAAG